MTHSRDPYRAIADMAAAIKVAEITETAVRESRELLDDPDFAPEVAREIIVAKLETASHKIARIQRGRTLS